MPIFRHLFSKPLSTTLRITSASGFHLRPIAQFTTLAKSFDARIEISFANQRVDATKINTLLSLGLDQGDHFSLEARGKDAKEALDALETLFSQLMQEKETTSTIKNDENSYQGEVIKAQSIAQGIAIAPLVYYRKQESIQETSTTYEEAISKSLKELESTSNTIHQAHHQLLESLANEAPTLKSLEALITTHTQQLKGGRHESKIADYHDILQRIKSHLGITTTPLLPKTPSILLACDLLPSEVDALALWPIEGVILKQSSRYSHTAIRLKALAIPSVLCDEISIDEDTMVLLDTDTGVIIPRPSRHDITQANQKKAQLEKRRSTIHTKRFEPAITKEGKEIQVYANIRDLSSAQEAKAQGARGVGLLRSEFLFEEHAPSLEEQVLAYEAIFETFEEVTIRTLDVGGDKALPYIPIPDEANPFLGIRGVRLLHTAPHMITEQLHAIVRASQGKKIKVMFPMISSIEEFKQIKTLTQQIAQKEGLKSDHLLFGIMIEVPSVLFSLDAFNQEVDFYSIGSNDLLQYLFAIERTHPTLTIDPLSPVVHTVIKHIMQHATKPVSICGEIASDKRIIPMLIQQGLQSLSVSVEAIASTKETIRHV
jgi:phosphotransferase system HPr (HPr) family protein